MYARVIKDGSNDSLKPFSEAHIDSKAAIKTDEWTAYHPLTKDFPHLRQVTSGKKGKNFPDMPRAILMLKAWLRGTHHAVGTFARVS